MRWKKITIETSTQAEDMLSYELSLMGMEGVEIEDHVPLTQEEMSQMYVDLLPDEIAADDGTARISCYIEDGEDVGAVLARIREKLDEIGTYLPVGSGEITLSVTEEEDWINNWKAFFKPFRLDDTIVIKPSWEELEETGPDDIIVEIDPGTAFGSGSHETTKLCIHALKKYVSPGTRLLDVGTGSGILSIIAGKLGTSHIDATDIDPNSIKAARENLEINGISDQDARVWRINLLNEEEAGHFRKEICREKYDIVVANILADVIIPLSGIVGDFLKEDGIFITSGIIDTMQDQVMAAMEAAGLEILDVETMKDWVSITARRA